METLDGVLSRVLYHQRSRYNPAGTPYLIARLANGETVKGEMFKPVEGERYRFYGEMRPQRGRDEPAFEFTSYEALADRSISGCEHYLAAHIDGIGWAKASRLAEAFGADTLDVLRADPDRALEVPGITQRIVDAIREHFENAPLDPVAFASLVDLFRRNDHRVAKSTVERIVRDFGASAPDVVTSNPYLLIDYPRIGWETADSFAMTTAGYPADGIERQAAALVEACRRVHEQGHTHAARAELDAGVHSLIKMTPSAEAWDAVLGDRLAGDGVRFALPGIWDAEERIAERLAILSAAGGPLPFELDPAGLGDDQAAALAVIHDHPVCLVVGPPGCGKSYAIARVIRSVLGPDRLDVVMVTAPTGKAAKRAAELIAQAGIERQVECTTIHRRLGPVPGGSAPMGASKGEAKPGRGRDEFAWTHNAANPLGCDLLIVDEASMVDVRLGAALLDAVAPGTRVIFVGDADQLPSVGPGSLLRDLIAAGVPRAELTTIKRSDGGGRVVRACHAIRVGATPEPARELDLPTENWIHVESSDPAEIADLVVELHRQARTFDPFRDYQVVSAQKGRHPFGCDALNRRLSDLLNPDDMPMEDGGPPFRVGDKVIRVKNGTAEELLPADADDLEFDDDAWGYDGEDWSLRDTVVVNGDLGVVEDIVREEKKSWVVVRFRDPDRLCRLPYGEHHLERAYAITVHKAQGSGYPVAIVPCHGSIFFDVRTGQGLWCRELFYTAISRAEKVLITVGQWAAIRAAIGRPTRHVRRTRLEGLAREALAPALAEAGL